MELHVFFANISWFLLIVILYMRPLADITNSRKLRRLLKYRKHLGIVCGFAALIHVILYLISYDLLVPFFTESQFWQFDNLFGWGNIALIALFIPFITSNRTSQKFFKKRWKTLQYFAYPAFIFTGIHVSFAHGNVLHMIPMFAWIVLWLWAYILKKVRRK